MALKFSKGVVNSIASGIGWGDVIKNSVIDVYSGSQPANADDAATGTKLCRFTASSGVLTAETRATAKLDFTSSTTSCTALTINAQSLIGGQTATGASPSAIAANVVTLVNSYWTFPDYQAVVGGTVVGSVTYGANANEVILIAPKNSANTIVAANNVVACTVGGGTVAINGGSSNTVGGTGATAGVAAANALTMTYPANLGKISKDGVWSANATANGTAAYFRLLATPNFDDGTTNLSSATDNVLIMRIDGSVGTSGSDIVISNTTIAANATQTVNTFDLTIA